MNKHTHIFPSGGSSCEATLFLPDALVKPPAILMAQGFGAERQMGTGGFVEAFLSAGFAVFTFDYRGFGGSQGRPRQYVHPGHHCEDWYNALQYLRSLTVIENSTIALWGSSFAGGHALVTAARDARVTAVIAQVPFCSSRDFTDAMSPGKTLRAAGHILLDLALSLIGHQHGVALVAEPGERFAAMDWPGWAKDYLKIVGDSPTWRNTMPARSLLACMNYHPIESAGQVHCPVLMISGRRDQGIPRESSLAMASAIPECRHLEWDFDHFDLYQGFALHEQARREQVSFLEEIFAEKETKIS